MPVGCTADLCVGFIVLGAFIAILKTFLDFDLGEALARTHRSDLSNPELMNDSRVATKLVHLSFR